MTVDYEAEASHLRGLLQQATLHVFGCASCGGDHRAVWVQQLHLPVHRNGGSLGVQRTYRRAFICPSTASAVLMSDDAEFSEVNDG